MEGAEVATPGSARGRVSCAGVPGPVGMTRTVKETAESAGWVVAAPGRSATSSSARAMKDTSGGDGFDALDGMEPFELYPAMRAFGPYREQHRRADDAETLQGANKPGSASALYVLTRTCAGCPVYRSRFGASSTRPLRHRTGDPPPDPRERSHIIRDLSRCGVWHYPTRANWPRDRTPRLSTTKRAWGAQEVRTLPSIGRRSDRQGAAPGLASSRARHTAGRCSVDGWWIPCGIRAPLERCRAPPMHITTVTDCRIRSSCLRGRDRCDDRPGPSERYGGANLLDLEPMHVDRRLVELLCMPRDRHSSRRVTAGRFRDSAVRRTSRPSRGTSRSADGNKTRRRRQTRTHRMPQRAAAPLTKSTVPSRQRRFVGRESERAIFSGAPARFVSRPHARIPAHVDVQDFPHIRCADGVPVQVAFSRSTAAPRRRTDRVALLGQQRQKHAGPHHPRVGPRARALHGDGGAPRIRASGSMSLLQVRTEGDAARVEARSPRPDNICWIHANVAVNVRGAGQPVRGGVKDLNIADDTLARKSTPIRGRTAGL